MSSPVLQTMAKIDEIFDEQRSSDQSFILKARIKTQEYLQQSVPFLRAKFVDSDQCIVLHVGQTIFGPMGCGTIQTIRPIDLKIVVKLSFGMMYCDVYEIATMIKLGKVCLPSSDIGLLNKFESLVNSYTNSFSERNEIAIATGLYDENVDTDIEDGPSGDVSIDDLGENGRGSFDLEGSILEQSKQEPSAATLEFDTYGTKYQNLSSEVQDSCFTRLSDQTPAHFRSKLHRKLSSNIYGEFTAVPLESLFLYFCPPGLTSTIEASKLVIKIS